MDDSLKPTLVKFPAEVDHEAVSAGPSTVHVWGPAPGRRWQVGITGLVIVAAFGGLLLDRVHHPGRFWLLLLAVIAALLCFLYELTREPCCLTTDATGLVLTGRNVSRSMAWDEITVATVGPAAVRLKLKSGASVSCPLVGYSLESRRALQEIVLAGARLAPDPAREAMYTREAWLDLQGSTQIAAPGQNGVTESPH